MYGEVPPMVVPFILPVDPLKHKTFDTTPLKVSVAGCEILILKFSEHPLASVTITEYVPENKPL
jgi:hypothetical protein